MTSRYTPSQESGRVDTPRLTGQQMPPQAASGAADACSAAALAELEAKLRQRTGREMYEHGYEDGWREGYEHGARLLEESWPAVVEPVLRDRPDAVELERRRWGPGGRERFGDLRPGDRHPREAA